MRVMVRAQVPAVIRSELDPREELGTHMTKEDIARIASVYNPDNPYMMKQLAGEMRAAREQKLLHQKDLLEGFKRQLGLSEPVIEAAGSIYESTIDRARRLGIRVFTAPVAAYAVAMAIRQFRVPIKTSAVVDASKVVNPARPVRMRDIMRLTQELPYHIESMSPKGWQGAAIKKLTNQGLVKLNDVPTILDRAAKIIDCLPNLTKASHSPAVLAAATLWYAITPEMPTGRGTVTQEETARASGTDVYQVRQFADEIRKKTDCV